jgi:hypothetical protein
MKNSLLLISIVSIFLASCGSDEYKNKNVTEVIISYPNTGTGTFLDPYLVGSGLYKFTGRRYYELETTKDDCNILIYGIGDFKTRDDALFIDYGHNNEIDSTYNYIYNTLKQDKYNLIVENSINDNDTVNEFGIFSTCLDESNGTPQYPIILKDSTRVIMSSSNILYKVVLVDNSTIFLNTTDGDISIKIYDHNIVNIYNDTSEKHSVDLPYGVYYILVSKLINNDDINFVFSVEEN